MFMRRLSFRRSSWIAGRMRSITPSSARRSTNDHCGGYVMMTEEIRFFISRVACAMSFLRTAASTSGGRTRSRSGWPLPGSNQTFQTLSVASTVFAARM
jgi:hypothetical protein